MPNHELVEIHRSKISLHRARSDYSYPTIRLPHTFSALAGLSTKICQTMHEGALAFLVVVSPGTSIEDADQIADEVESRFATDCGCQYCTVHVEPDRPHVS